MGCNRFRAQAVAGLDSANPTAAEQTAGIAIRADIDVAALDATQDGIVDLSVLHPLSSVAKSKSNPRPEIT